MQLMRGRGITGADREGSLRAAVVNEAYVRERVPRGQGAVGRRFVITYADDRRPWTIVGVVRDAKYNDKKICRNCRICRIDAAIFARTFPPNYPTPRPSQVGAFPPELPSALGQLPTVQSSISLRNMDFQPAATRRLHAWVYCCIQNPRSTAISNPGQPLFDNLNLRTRFTEIPVTTVTNPLAPPHH